MKIAFTGAHGVGKTTLINSIKRRLAQEIDIEVTEEVPRIICEIVNDPEYFRRANNTLPKQLLILLGQVILEYKKRSNTLICDRTIFDHWAYTTFLFKDEIDKSLSKSIELFLIEHMRSYDMIFYLPIEFEVEDDGTRESDRRFQADIDSIILNNLERNKLDYKRISGSIEERAKKVIQIIKT